MASTPKNRGEWKRKKSPTTKETETLEQKEDRLVNGLFDNIVAVNSLVDRQGPYKNTANEVKIKLRELQKLCGRVLDIRRMRAETKDEDLERTPKRAKRIAVVEDKGTNTSTGGEMEGLEWDDDLGTETEWKEVKAKKKGRRRKENKTSVATNSKSKRDLEEKKEKNEKYVEKSTAGEAKRNKAITKESERKNKRNAEERKPVGRKPEGKKPMAKPEALLVEVKDRDYASVLKEVKSGLAKEEIVFSRVRKTRRGDILLELEKGQNGGASAIKEKVGGIYPSLTLRALKESSNVIIKGLDITVEKEEIDEVLRQKVRDFRIKSFWENNYGVKTAIIELPKEEAQKLIDEKKIKIGWMRVPVRLLAEKKKCYRCLEYGHISTGCPGQDRSKKCFNCGNEGHKAKECVNETTCAICKDKGQVRSNHRVGSKSCPSWKEKVPGIQIMKSKNGG